MHDLVGSTHPKITKAIREDDNIRILIPKFDRLYQVSMGGDLSQVPPELSDLVDHGKLQVVFLNQMQRSNSVCSVNFKSLKTKVSQKLNLCETFEIKRIQEVRCIDTLSNLREY